MKKSDDFFYSGGMKSDKWFPLFVLLLLPENVSQWFRETNLHDCCEKL